MKLLLLFILLTSLPSPPLQAETTNLTIKVLTQRNLVRLNWERQPLVAAWQVYRSLQPLFQTALENFYCTVTDTFLYDSLTTPRAFYAVVPLQEEYAISARQRDLVLHRGGDNREYFSTVQMSADSTGLALLTLLPASERETPWPQPAAIYWSDNGLAVFDDADSLLLNRSVGLPAADPWSGLDNGRRGLLGGYPHFDYHSFAQAGGWQIIPSDSLLILQKDTLRQGEPVSLRLVIDNGDNQLRQSEAWRSGRGLVTRFYYFPDAGQLLLERREQFSFRADTLQRVVITEFSDYNLAAEAITLHPVDWPPTPATTPPPCPAPAPPDQYTAWSGCSLLSAMENMSQTPRVERTDCDACHQEVPPRAILLLHGLNSDPTMFNLIQNRLETGYDCFFYRPFFTSDFTAARMRDSLAARLERLGDFQWLGIGHSLGGLVGRDLLQQQEGSQRLHSLITIASPHNGANLLSNNAIARELCQDLRDDIEDLLSLDLIDWLLGTNLAQTFESLDSYFDQIEDCAAWEELLPDSPYIAQLQNGQTTQPYAALGCRTDYWHPLAELYAGLTVEFTPPYPFGELDQQRDELRDQFIDTYNDLVTLTWNFRFIDAVNDIHWDLVTLNSDWSRYVLEAEYEWTYPLYDYHEDGDCFFCPRPPFCGREWCCQEYPQDPDGARFWCCSGCGEDIIVCYLGDASTTIELPNDAILTLREQTWRSGADSSRVEVAGPAHSGEKASDAVLEAVTAILNDWGWAAE